RREHGTFSVRLVRARAGARGRLLRGFLGRTPGGLLGALRVGEFARSFLLRHSRLLSGSLPPPNDRSAVRSTPGRYPLPEANRQAGPTAAAGSARQPQAGE